MKNSLNLKKIFICFILFIFLFPSLNVYTNYSLADNETEGDAVTDTTKRSIDSYEKSWKIAPFYTSQGAGQLGGAIDSKYSSLQLVRNEDYGWYEFKEKEETYVALLGLTEETEDMYCFKIGETIYFQFDQRYSNDKNIYKGKIIGAVSSTTIHEQGGDTNNSQYIFAYVGTNEEAGAAGILNKVEKFTDKEILVSDTGKFPANIKKTAEGNLLVNVLSTALLFLGDLIEQLLTAEVYNISLEEMPEGFPIYTKEDINARPDLQEALQLEIYEEKKKNKNNAKNDNTEVQPEDNTQLQVENNKKGGIYTFTVPMKLVNQAGNYANTFENFTSVPIIPSDLFVLSRTKINICDIDFFSKDNTNSNKLFGLVRSVVKNGSKIMMYFTAALILTILIFRSIMLVIATYSQRPEKAKNARKKINALLKYVLLLVFIYFIIIFILYLYKEVLSMVSLGEDVYYPLRLVVNEGFSFNTTIVGAVRTLTLTSNGLYKLLYSLFYCVIAIISMIWFVIMIIRMFAIALFIVLAPLTVIYTSNVESEGEAKGVFHFANWFKIYNILVWMPILLVLIERIVSLIFH